MDCERERELETLMERLRNRSSHHHKSWVDSIKAVRNAIINDKRHHSEALEKGNLQACLDKLQRAMKVVNQQSLVERLELLARQLGLSFTPPLSQETAQVSMNSDMFHVQIMLDGQGGIRDAKIGHQENTTTCEELIEVLSKRDFDEFMSHLTGLQAIYQISGDKKQKYKAYLALDSLERDLNDLAQLQSSINGVANYIHKSPLGILLQRKGGHPMKLIYFVSPYDLLNKKARSSYPMTVEAITENGLGHCVTVSLEPAASNRLQTMPLMSIKSVGQDGKSLPSFQGLSAMNSCVLPASFVLVLPQPIPVSKSVIKTIQEITELDVITTGEEKSLYNLILETFSKGKVKNNELYVTLPDQNHVYYLNNVSGGCLGEMGAIVTKIPFTHPTSVAKVLNALRQQLLFNTVISSCIRHSPSQGARPSIVFEMTAVSLQHISVMFEHPLMESMITVELDLSDITNVKCSVCTGQHEEKICSDDFSSKTFQRCFSVPVTLRAVIHKVKEQIKKLTPPVTLDIDQPETLKIAWPRDFNANHSSVIPKENDRVPLLHELPFKNRYGIADFFRQQPFLAPPPPDDRSDKPQSNPLLATLLDQGSPPHVQQESLSIHDSPMLSKLLEDSTSVAATLPPFPAPKKRITKRKSSKDLAGRSPKHRHISDGDSSGEKFTDLDSSGGSHDFDALMRSASVSSVGSVGTGPSPAGSIIDLTESDPFSESLVKKLENTMDNYIPRESKFPGGTGTQGELADMLSISKDINKPPDPHRVSPKNEQASTSLEGQPLGLGEGRDYIDPQFIPNKGSVYPQKRTPMLKRQDSISRSSLDSMDTCSEPSGNDLLSPPPINLQNFLPNVKMENINFPESKYTVLPSYDGKLISSNQTVLNFQMNSKPDPHDLKAHFDCKTENRIFFPQEREGNIKSEEGGGTVMKLKLNAMKQYDSISPTGSDDSKSRTSAFDFHSDDEEFEFQSMTVVSSSPTRLQISNKSKPSRDSKLIKSDKCKRKESKSSRGISSKRKREKDELKKEKKKKKLESYTIPTDGAVYRSTTVNVESVGNNEFKPMPKIKITKSVLMEGTGAKLEAKIKDSSLKASYSEEGIFDKIEAMKNEHIRQNSIDGLNSKKHVSSKSQKSHKTHQRSFSSSSIAFSKSDSKLVTKTPTIKLKPIVMPSTGASVNVSSSRTPTTPTTPTNKSITASPTSATIGKIGAVSLATSGSAKTSSNSKSPTNAAIRSGNHSSKSSIAALLNSNKSNSTGSLVKVGSNLSSKNSPSSQHGWSNTPTIGRSSSLSSILQSKISGNSNRSTSTSGGRTSLPSLPGNKGLLNSGSRSLSNRDKSTSSSKGALTPTTGHKEAAANVLSFLNPNAGSIASLPPIPKLSSTSGNSNKGSNVGLSKGGNTPTSQTSVNSSKVPSQNSTPSSDKVPEKGPSLVISNASKSSNTQTNSSTPSRGNGSAVANNSTKLYSNQTSTSSGESSQISSSVSKHEESSKTKLICSAGIRGRKSSLSAIVDKLHVHVSKSSSTPTKSSQTTNDASHDNVKESVNPNSESISEKRDRIKTDNRRPSVSPKDSPKYPVDFSRTASNVNNGQTKYKGNENDRNMVRPSSLSIQKNNLGSGKRTSSTSSPNPKHSLAENVTLRKSLDSPSASKLSHARVESKAEARLRQGSSTSSEVTTPPKKSCSVESDTTPMDSTPAKIAIKDGSEVENTKGNDSSEKRKVENSNHLKQDREELVYSNQSTRTENRDSVGSEIDNRTEQENESVFKVPTPKSPSWEDRAADDIENIAVRRKSRSVSKPIQSPSSPCSSPENGLIIDYPPSPRHLQNKTNSPQCNIDPSTPSKISVHKSPSPIFYHHQSPMASPTIIKDSSNSNPGSVAYNSPCIIDDDLMDEALML
ncbi:hypothetical protein CHS0354_017310 [Potamilus streckersoni]|uniref:Mediator of RNA polymerase II transcription subunit 1 n=1 Tax=Potamilus streckersoni TaxID=2493646 RepID=A0AAE0T5J2_9BIVA|nr:hypothetical protein CHS0354_017310 [Potamilus streckersoni]